MSATLRPQTSALVAELLSIGVLRMSADGSSLVLPDGTIYNALSAQASNRALTATDNGSIIDCTGAAVSLTIPFGLPQPFACKVLTNGTTSFISTGGTLLNGATATLTRVAATAGNAAVDIVSRSVANSYVVTGS